MLTQPEIDMVKTALDASSAAYQTLVYGTRVEGIIDWIAATIVVLLSAKMCSMQLKHAGEKHGKEINELDLETLVAIAMVVILYAIVIGFVLYVMSEAILPIAMPDYVVIRNIIHVIGGNC